MTNENERESHSTPESEQSSKEGLQANQVAEYNERARNANPRDIVEKQQQDLGETRLRGPDRNWPSGNTSRGAVAVPPTREQLERKSQFVRVRNSSDRFPGTHGRVTPQTHIVFDRFQRAIELQPGQTREIEMTVGDIHQFVQLGRSGRTNDFGQQLPRHPIEIMDIDKNEIEKQARDDEREKQRKRAEREQGLEKAKKQFAGEGHEQEREEGNKRQAFDAHLRGPGHEQDFRRKLQREEQQRKRDEGHDEQEHYEGYEEADEGDGDGDDEGQHSGRPPLRRKGGKRK